MGFEVGSTKKIVLVKGQVTVFRTIGRRKTFGVHMVGGPKVKSEKKKTRAKSQKRTGLKMN